MDAVVNCIQIKVLNGNQAGSMNVLNELYGIGISGSRYRNKLKIKIKEKYPDKLHFVTIDKNKPDVIIIKETYITYCF